MLEILLMNTGPLSDPIRFTVTRERSEIDGGQSNAFMIRHTGGVLNATYYWALEGSGVPYVDSPTEGSWVTTNDTTRIPITTKKDTSFTDRLELNLVIRARSATGPRVFTSVPIVIQYRAHPVGQQDFLNPGTHTFTVPERVTQLAMVCVGGGQGAYDLGGDRGGEGGSLRWRNYVDVTPGETLTVVVGKGGTMSLDLAVRNGENSSVSRPGDPMLVGGGGGRHSDSTPITITREGNGWDIPSAGYVVGGGDGGLPATVTNDNGPSGGGGAGGYLGNGGRGGSRTQGGTGGQDRSGAGGGGAYYHTASNDSHHAIAGGGVGLRGSGRTGDPAVRNDAVSAAKAGSNGSDGTWIQPGLYGGGARGRSTNSAFGAVNGGNGAVRLIWGTGRSYPSTLTDNQPTSS